jgi:hypothetical protein
MPEHISEHCVLRTRYNITTKDYGALDAHNSGQVNAALNKRAGNNPARVNVGENYNIPGTDSANPEENGRGYLWENNPQVTIFDFETLVRFCQNVNLEIAEDPTRCNTADPPVEGQTTLALAAYCPAGYTEIVYDEADGTPTGGTGNDCNVQCRDPTNADEATNTRARISAPNNCAASANTLRDTNANGDGDFNLQLAINTAQFGRTFQDRSHSYAVRAQDPDNFGCSDIHALNVRGKRGNVVQTFPGTEYDFVPNVLHVSQGECIHFQWTGSNTNPHNNDGQGQQGSDRSNIALLEKVRGEGGRGVQRFGGNGADGTTWTTADMEPGMEGYVPGSKPTMADLTCDSAPGIGMFDPANPDKVLLVHAVPHEGWEFCSNCAADQFRGMLPESGNCPAGFTRSNRCGGVCVSDAADPTCECKERAVQPERVSGICVDARDSEAFACTMDQVGVLEEEKNGAWGGSHPEHMANCTEWAILGFDAVSDFSIIVLWELAGVSVLFVCVRARVGLPCPSTLPLTGAVFATLPRPASFLASF